MVSGARAVAAWALGTRLGEDRDDVDRALIPIARTYEDEVDTPVVTTMLVMAMTMMRAMAR